jgi:hypothetical protein
MPQLGANNPGDGGQGGDVDGIRVDAFTLKIFIKHPAAGNSGKPKQDAESANLKTTNVNKWIHARQNSLDFQYMGIELFAWLD